MAVTFGFYNSVTGDRAYNATQMSSLFDGLIQDGVFMSVGAALVVIPSDPASMNIIVGEGRAWFKHSWTLNDSELVLAIGNPDVTYTRIDAVILEIDANTNVRANSIKVVAGTPSSNPVPPTMTHTTLLNQYPLAYITVPIATTEIIAANITNKVGTTDCPFVTDIVQTFSINTLIAQWESDFDNVWLPARLVEFNAWLGLRVTDWTVWLGDRLTDYNAWIALRLNDWTVWLDDRQDIWAAWLIEKEGEFDAWIASLHPREVLIANRTYYVRTDGNDANTGLVNTSGGAWLTIQHAVDVVTKTLDLATYDVTISVMSGTFTGAVELKPYLSSGGLIKIIGQYNEGLIVTTVSTTLTCFTCSDCGCWVLEDLKLISAQEGAIFAEGQSKIDVNRIEFGVCGVSHCFARSGALIRLLADYSISGAGSLINHLEADYGGKIYSNYVTATFTGQNLDFDTFANSYLGGLIDATGMTYAGYDEQVTGTRYSSVGNAIINTTGGGASFFPGDVAGSVATGGIYL